MAGLLRAQHKAAFPNMRYVQIARAAKDMPQTVHGAARVHVMEEFIEP